MAVKKQEDLAAYVINGLQNGDPTILGIAVAIIVGLLTIGMLL